MCNVYQDYQVPSSRLLSVQVPDTAEDWRHLSQVWTPHVAAVTSALDIFTILQLCNDGMDPEPIKECRLHQRWMGVASAGHCVDGGSVAQFNLLPASKGSSHHITEGSVSSKMTQ